MVLSVLPMPMETGWAAPMLVPGAMAATFAAMVTKTPAEAARAPSGIDIDDHRDFGVADGLDDLAHGGFQTAGGVQFNHQGLGVLALRQADALHHEFRQPGVNGAHRRQHVNRPGRGRPGRRPPGAAASAPA